MIKTAFVRQLCLIGLMGSSVFVGAVDVAKNEHSDVQKQENTLVQSLRDSTIVFGAGLGVLAGLLISPIAFFSLNDEDFANLDDAERAATMCGVATGGAVVGVAAGALASFVKRVSRRRDASTQ